MQEKLTTSVLLRDKTIGKQELNRTKNLKYNLVWFAQNKKYNLSHFIRKSHFGRVNPNLTLHVFTVNYFGLSYCFRHY